MDDEKILNELQKRNNVLKSKLIHNQLKHDIYNFSKFKNQSLIFIDEYKKHKSFFKASIKSGVSQDRAFNWFIHGQCGNTMFKPFYLAISNISANNIANNDYEISQYGDGWSYKTYIDGEKIFIIANELDDLKNKVKSKNLPID